MLVFFLYFDVTNTYKQEVDHFKTLQGQTFFHFYGLSYESALVSTISKSFSPSTMTSMNF